jgi:hypothetical protein
VFPAVSDCAISGSQTHGMSMPPASKPSPSSEPDRHALVVIHFPAEPQL